MNNLVKGFSLIELLITVAIIGILAGIGYPSYSAFVLKSNRAEAQNILLQLANKQEQYYMDHRAYTTDLKDLGKASTIITTESGNYKVRVTSASTNEDFKLRAWAQGGQATNDAVCKNMWITNTGEKTATSTECWEE